MFGFYTLSNVSKYHFQPVLNTRICSTLCDNKVWRVLSQKLICKSQNEPENKDKNAAYFMNGPLLRVIIRYHSPPIRNIWRNACCWVDTWDSAGGDCSSNYRAGLVLPLSRVGVQRPTATLRQTSSLYAQGVTQHFCQQTRPGFL